MTDPESKGIPSQEDVEKEISEAAQVLHEQAGAIRDGIPAENWARLVRWRWVWIMMRRVYLIASMSAGYLLFWLVIAAVTGGLRPPRLEQIAWWPVIAVLASAPLVRLAMWCVQRLACRDLERLEWLGYNPLLVEEALWKEYYAQGIDRHRSRIASEQVARARLSVEASKGPPWYVLELSGAHLVFWLSAVTVAVSAAARGRIPPPVYGPALAVVIAGAPLKFIFWPLYHLTTTSAKVGRLRFYRWWGAGWLPVAIALAPAAFVMWLIL